MANYSVPKLSVKDSFDDEEVSDDVDDEVFIRDGRNGRKVDEERGIKIPLMAPRRKIKGSTHINVEHCKRQPLSIFCAPCCYAVIALGTLLGILVLVILVINMIPLPLGDLNIWRSHLGVKPDSVVPCTEISTRDIWLRTFLKLTSEVPVQLVDVDNDGVDDIIVGYGTIVGTNNMRCEQEPCRGGVLALAAKDGRTLWQHWTHSAVLFLDCKLDLNTDRISDCVAAGKAGLLLTINGRDGSRIWELSKPTQVTSVDIYSAQFVADMNADGTPDILAAHTSNHAGHLVLLNGRNGEVLRRVEGPLGEGLYSSPVLFSSPDGELIVLFTTSSLEKPVGLYALPLRSLALGDVTNCILLARGAVGLSAAPVLVDLNMDGTEDIVTSAAGQITAIDGRTHKHLWNYTAGPFSAAVQILTSPTTSYFNDDKVPDLLVSLLVGPFFLTYYYSQALVLDGRSGEPLLDNPVTGSGQITPPSLTLSVEALGNDYFLYWVTVCAGTNNYQQPFQFEQGTSVHMQARTDFCRLRFNSSLETRLYALSQHVQPPGILLYSSGTGWSAEHNVSEEWMPPPVLIPTPPPTLSNFRQNHYSNKGGVYNDWNSQYEQHVMSAPQAAWQPQEPLSQYSQSSLPIGRPLAEPADYALNMEGLDPGYLQEGEDTLGPGPQLGIGRNEREGANWRSKRDSHYRHVDIPAATSAGALLSPLTNRGAIDLVLVTQWVMPSQHVRILLPHHERCIAARMQQANGKLAGLDREEAMRECLGPLHEDEGQVEGGVLAVRRLSLDCRCSQLRSQTERCSAILPLSEQSFHQIGLSSNFKPRH